MVAGRCRFLAVLAMLFLPVTAVAQVIPPSAQPGREREQLAPPVQGPRAQPGGATITLPSTVAPPGAEGIRLTIGRVVVTGATVYSEADFAPLYADLLGGEVSLAAIYDLARRITVKYGAAGYVLSRAVVPPQNFGRHGAVVRIQVVEGYVDNVVWPEKLTRYRDFFTDYANRIVADRPANIRTLERYLLLANDLPGLKFSTTLKPSPTNPNASTLIVEVAEKPLDGMARIDNRGTHARGPWQYVGSATLNNTIARAHEAFTLTYAGTFQVEELQYLAFGYRQVLNSEGLTAFINASHGFGRPGTEQLLALDYRTRSTLFEAGFSYPVIRTREKNLTLTGLGFATNDDSTIAGSEVNPFTGLSYPVGVLLTRDRLRGFRLKADGDWADSFLGINQANVTFSQGIQGLGSTANGNPIASTNAGRVDFTKIEGTVSRLQPLIWNFSAFVAAYGQYAFTPLLVSEQCGYGGRFFGRAFDPSQMLGDHCWAVLGELRYDIPLGIKRLTRAQLYAYADHGQVYNIDPALGTPKTEHGTSAGVGGRAEWDGIYSADLSVAKAVEGPRNDWRAFLILAAKL
jgi:hemolysin activation/secretion protein